MESYTSRPVARRGKIGSTQQLPSPKSAKGDSKRSSALLRLLRFRRALTSMRWDTHTHVCVRELSVRAGVGGKDSRSKRLYSRVLAPCNLRTLLIPDHKFRVHLPSHIRSIALRHACVGDDGVERSPSRTLLPNSSSQTRNVHFIP